LGGAGLSRFSLSCSNTAWYTCEVRAHTAFS
jgi:hypothetical protein